jgi:hypothetical protein
VLLREVSAHGGLARAGRAEQEDDVHIACCIFFLVFFLHVVAQPL